MALEATAPVSFPVPKENEPVRRRAVFSHSVRGAESHHALSPDDAAAIRTRRRRKTNDDSLQLIDDLVNRPMDPMFSDSRLVHEHRSTFSIWFNRIVVFIICVGVGFACSYSCNSCNPIRVSRYGRLWPRNWRIATRK